MSRLSLAAVCAAVAVCAVTASASGASDSSLPVRPWIQELTEEDVLIAASLRLLSPTNVTVTKTLAVHFWVQAVNAFGSPVPTPHGTVCIQTIDDSGGVFSERCFDDKDARLTIGDSEAHFKLHGPFPDGTMRARVVLWPTPAHVFVQPDRPGRPAAAFFQHHGRTEDPGAPLYSPVVQWRYELACRDCLSLDATKLPYDDDPRAAFVLRALACQTASCDDVAAFMTHLVAWRSAHHPAVAGRDAALLTRRTTVPPVRTRGAIPAMLDADGGMRIGVEVGCQRGANYEVLLAEWTSAVVVFCVDPWVPQDHYVDTANLDLAGQTANMQATIAATQRFGPRAWLIRDFSLAAAARFPNGVLDYVYLDARHDYLSVTEDLEAYWPKLRAGGVMAGHDFLDAEEAHRNFKGASDWAVMSNGTVHPTGKAVKGAVLDFAERVNRQVVVAYADGAWPSWMIRK